MRSNASRQNDLLSPVNLPALRCRTRELRCDVLGGIQARQDSQLVLIGSACHSKLEKPLYSAFILETA
jgi:hypothetical protein